jgi:tRNA1Val (adenine37-N6)-methyltransferase
MTEASGVPENPGIPKPLGMPDILRPGERLDDLQLNGLRVIQNPRYFCFGADAVCLANFAAARKGEAVLDICTGSGVVPILMSAKTKARHFTGLELLPHMADMARRSVAINKLEERICIDEGDVKQAADLYGPAVFDVVTVNPPYMHNNTLNARGSKAIARQEIACTLTDVVQAAARVLKTNGRLYMVHRPHRLADIFRTLNKHKLEPKTLRLVQARADKPPSLALIEAAQGGKPHFAVLPSLLLEEYHYTSNKPHA